MAITDGFMLDFMFADTRKQALRDNKNKREFVSSSWFKDSGLRIA